MILVQNKIQLPENSWAMHPDNRWPHSSRNYSIRWHLLTAKSMNCWTTSTRSQWILEASSMEGTLRLLHRGHSYLCAVRFVVIVFALDVVVSAMYKLFTSSLPSVQSGSVFYRAQTTTKCHNCFWDIWYGGQEKGRFPATSELQLELINLLAEDRAVFFLCWLNRYGVIMLRSREIE